MNEPCPRGYRFDGFRINVGSRSLMDAERAAIALTGKAFDVLLYLVEHAGQLVTKDELLAQIWAGRVVDENNLTQAVSTLRKALGTGAGDHRYILTEARRGYRFVADVRDEDAHGFPVANMRRATNAPMAPQRRTMRIAVLPFRVLSGTAQDEWLELGLADTLITQLSHSSVLCVHSLTSSQGSADTSQDVFDAGRRLGASHVVDGSIQCHAGQVRINARLLEVASGRTLWAGTFDARPDNLFTQQDRIAAAVALALKTDTRGRSACDGANPDAYRAYLIGLHQASRPDPARLTQALAAFHRAIDLDPTCARAYAGLASAYRGQVNIGEHDPREIFPLAKAAAEQALRIDPASAEAWSAKASIQYRYDWDWAGAEVSFERAIALNPSFPNPIFGGYGHLLVTLGRVDEGLSHARQACELDPLSPLANVIEAGLLAAAGRAGQARARLARALELQPDFWLALLYRGEMALAREDFGVAIADFEHAVARSNGNSNALAMLGVAHAAAGDSTAAEDVLRRLQAEAAGGYQPATSQAAVHSALGRTGQALNLLERAYVERDVRLCLLNIGAQWDGLRTQPRFRALARRMNLEQ